MLERIRQLKPQESEFCQLVLSTAALAYRSLHLCELGVLSFLPEHISCDIGNVERVTQLCGSFLSVRVDYVYLIHQSVKDYLTADASSSILTAGREAIHHAISEKSLQVLSYTLRRDNYCLSHPGFPADYITPSSPDPWLLSVTRAYTGPTISSTPLRRSLTTSRTVESSINSLITNSSTGSRLSAFRAAYRKVSSRYQNSLYSS